MWRNYFQIFTWVHVTAVLPSVPSKSNSENCLHYAVILENLFEYIIIKFKKKTFVVSGF